MLVSTLAWGDPEIVRMRQQLMQSNQQAVRLAMLMIRGTVPYDGAILEAAMSQIAHETSAFPIFFPESAKATPSEALPAVYTENKKFRAIAAKMVADAEAAAAAAPKGVAIFRTAFNAVAGNCEDCHETFRGTGGGAGPGQRGPGRPGGPGGAAGQRPPPPPEFQSFPSIEHPGRFP